MRINFVPERRARLRQQLPATRDVLVAPQNLQHDLHAAGLAAPGLVVGHGDEYREGLFKQTWRAAGSVSQEVQHGFDTAGCSLTHAAVTPTISDS